MSNTPKSYLSAGAANQDSTVVAASTQQLNALSLHNNSAAIRYVKFYDKATAPTSADIPVARYPLAANGGGVTRQQLVQRFINGIAFRITTGSADNDVGAATAGDVAINLDFAPNG